MYGKNWFYMVVYGHYKRGRPGSIIRTLTVLCTFKSQRKKEKKKIYIDGDEAKWVGGLWLFWFHKKCVLSCCTHCTSGDKECCNVVLLLLSWLARPPPETDWPTTWSQILPQWVHQAVCSAGIVLFLDLLAVSCTSTKAKYSPKSCKKKKPFTGEETQAIESYFEEELEEGKSTSAVKSKMFCALHPWCATDY